MDDNCLFCKIIKKEIQSEIIFENNDVIAFNDINPVAPVHVLIVPKIHLVNVNDIDESNKDVVGEIHLAAKKIGVLKGIDNYRLITNCGKEAGQTVFHLHYHFIGGKQINYL